MIAGVLTSHGATSRLLDAWGAGDFELVACPQVVYEVRKALVSPRISERYRVSKADVEAFTSKLREESLFVSDPIDPPRVVPEDPNDDYLVALAIASGSGILVTRDRHFEGVEVEGLRILHPATALDLIDGRL